MPTQQDLAQAGVDYREAMAAVTVHLRRQADAEVAQIEWLKRHRGVPAHVLYDADTGEPLDPELVDLEEAIRAAEADGAWCRALVIACGEAVKGETFDDVMVRHEQGRGD